ncbi:MAG: cytochrome d ubiquinol oxidase subunit II, partial [Bacteroidales bacterium]|nr:cytochrome d ubiquinol oxidase subunit II [Bacteroidales bacterium]
MSLEKYKYLHNLIQMPAVLVIFLCGVAAVLYGILRTVLSKVYDRGIWWTGAGTVLAVLSLFLIAGWNGTAYYPSTADIQSSLTIANSSSSQFTLKVLTFVSFIIPFVVAYIAYAWHAMDRR